MTTIAINHRNTEIHKLPNRSNTISRDKLPTTEKLRELNLRLQALKSKTHLLDNVELSEYAIRKLTCS